MNTNNALHAAAVWADRQAAPPEAVAVVRLHPHTAVGLWLPDRPHVGMKADATGDDDAELCEAAGAWVEEALEWVGAPAREAVRLALLGGARLEALLAPAAGTAELRMVHAGQAVQLIAARLDEPMH